MNQAAAYEAASNRESGTLGAIPDEAFLNGFGARFEKQLKQTDKKELCDVTYPSRSDHRR